MKSREFTYTLVIAVFCFACDLTTSVADAEARKRIVLIAGAKSHEVGAHEYLKTVRLLKSLLDRAPNLEGIQTEIYFNGWPDDPAELARADTIAFFSDGENRLLSSPAHAPFMTSERIRILERQMRRGCGLVTFHYSTFAPREYAPEILDWIGGYFDWQSGHGEGGHFGAANDAVGHHYHSMVRVADVDVRLDTPAHPISAGVPPVFHIRDEFYYQLRFKPYDRRVTPILSVPAFAGQPQDRVVAWAVERQDGGRGFGMTMGHYFQNWQNDAFRRLMLNALVWTARAAVPEGGVASVYEQR